MKKFLAGLLTLAIAVSMLTTTAFADETEGGSTDTESNNAILNIDENEKGSITIHKYAKLASENKETNQGEQNEGDEENAEVIVTWPESTGGVLNNLPSNAHPLDGVTFTVYKIADADDVLDYYSGVQERIDKVKDKIPTRDNLFDPEDEGTYMGYDYACKKHWNTHKWILNPDGPWGNDNRYPAELIGSLTTGDTTEGFNPGEVVFSNLAVGIYLVIETDSPDTVVAPADPFLVSIPMTINNEWKYDVHVYPKNVTIVSDRVRIAKCGKIAGTTSKPQPLQGAKFQLEKKVKDPTGDPAKDTWVLVTQTEDKSGNTNHLGNQIEGKEGEYDGIITSQQDGFVTVSGLSPGEYRFVEIETPEGYILPGKGGWYFTITSNGNVVWSTVENPGNDENKQNFVVGTTWFGDQDEKEEDGEPSSGHDVGGIPCVINDRPDIEKKVVPKKKVNETGVYQDVDYAKEANYSVGDEIPYKLTINVPGLGYSLTTLTVSDNPTNMKDNQESIKIWINDTEITESAVTLATYGKFIEESENENGFKFSFIPKSLKDYTGENIGNYGTHDVTITIEYTATLLKSASVTAKEGNPNEVTLEYSNSYAGGGTNKITDRTVVYSGEIDVNKTNGTEPLKGVEFVLYEQLIGRGPYNPESGEENKMNILTAAEAAEAGLTNSLTNAYVKIGGTYTTGGDGKTSMKGLSDGTYWLVETKTKEGYNLLPKPVEVVLALGHNTEMEDSDWSYQVSEKEIVRYEQYFNEYGAPVWDEETKDFKMIEIKETKVVKEAVVNKNVIDYGKSTYAQTVTVTETVDGTEEKVNVTNLGREIPVINRSGFDLPATGGMGTFLFTFVGIAMMAAAVILFITSKKKEVK